MSADLHLVAQPNDPEVIRIHDFLRGAETIIYPTHGDVLERDADGYVVTASGWHGITINEKKTLEEQIGYHTWDNIWVGQVSWAKGLGNPSQHEAWVPTAIETIDQLFENAPTLTPTLATATMVALNQPNRSNYGKRHWRRAGSRPRLDRSRGLAKRQHVKRWLDAHLGQRIAAESW